jgi:hypothetical protein
MHVSPIQLGSCRFGLAATLAILSAACNETVGTTAGAPDGAVSADSTAGVVADARAGDSTADGGWQCGATSGRVPLIHHPAGSTCPQQRPPGTPTASCTADAGGLCPLDGCFQDSDCKMGINGRCVDFGGPAILDCSYDQCFQDTDCDAGQACLCRPSNNDGPPSIPNVCAPAGNCTVDSDCGPSGYCSPSNIGPTACACVTQAPCDGPDGSGVTNIWPPQPPPSVGCFESTDGGPWVQVACSCSSPYPCGHGYYCHTACDECVDDVDCPAGACNYSLVDQRWECIATQCPL